MFAARTVGQRIIIVCLAASLAGCAHRAASLDANASGSGTALDSMLRLEIETPATISIGTVKDVRYNLKNVGDQPLDLCIDGDGISTWISFDRLRTRWISVLYRAASDPCHIPLHLEPGEGKTFAERAGVPKSASPGSATLHGSVAVKWPKEGMRGVIRAERKVEIAAH